MGQGSFAHAPVLQTGLHSFLLICVFPDTLNKCAFDGEVMENEEEDFKLSYFADKHRTAVHGGADVLPVRGRRDSLSGDEETGGGLGRGSLKARREKTRRIAIQSLPRRGYSPHGRIRPA